MLAEYMDQTKVVLLSIGAILLLCNNFTFAEYTEEIINKEIRLSIDDGSLKLKRSPQYAKRKEDTGNYDRGIIPEEGKYYEPEDDGHNEPGRRHIIINPNQENHGTHFGDSDVPEPITHYSGLNPHVEDYEGEYGEKFTTGRQYIVQEVYPAEGREFEKPYYNKNTRRFEKQNFHESRSHTPVSNSRHIRPQNAGSYNGDVITSEGKYEYGNLRPTFYTSQERKYQNDGETGFFGGERKGTGRHYPTDGDSSPERKGLYHFNSPEEARYYKAERGSGNYPRSEDDYHQGSAIGHFPKGSHPELQTGYV